MKTESITRDEYVDASIRSLQATRDILSRHIADLEDRVAELVARLARIEK